MAKRSRPEIVDVEALRAALAAAEARADRAVHLADEAQRAEADAAALKARVSGDAALIAHLRLEIAKLSRTLYGQRSERTQRLLDQYELQLEELEASASTDALAAKKAATRVTMPTLRAQRKPSRQPFPAHLPRVRLVVPGPTVCPCCGGTRLSKMGERGRHRDVGGGAAALDGDPDCARALLLPEPEKPLADRAGHTFQRPARPEAYKPYHRSAVPTFNSMKVGCQNDR